MKKLQKLSNNPLIPLNVQLWEIKRNYKTTKKERKRSLERFNSNSASSFFYKPISKIIELK